jgi:16S rRNA (guanine(966)-N(2))-methyltransferase RsmD
MRVVAGRLRGRRLLSDPAAETRPTSDRARAGVFDWLGSRVVEARVLDLFAGSGSLGIEALSRGATSAVFVERARGALAALRRNLAELELGESADVVARDLRTFLRKAVPEQGRYDLVLADPPYGSDWPGKLLASESLAALLDPRGVLVVERSARDVRPECAAGFAFRASKSYGETVFDWFEREEEEEAR